MASHLGRVPTADSGVFDKGMVARCDFVMSRCQSDDNWNTLQPSLPASRQSYNAPSATICLQQQLFVSGGDIFVYAQSELCFYTFCSFHSRAPSNSLHT